MTALQEIGSTIARLSEIASSVASSVEAQDMTAEQISSSVKHAAQGTSEVASGMSDVNKEASNTGSASGRVLASARGLSVESNKLRDEGRQVPRHRTYRVIRPSQAANRRRSFKKIMLNSHPGSGALGL